jgi:hypothetical protein
MPSEIANAELGLKMHAEVANLCPGTRRSESSMWKAWLTAMFVHGRRISVLDEGAGGSTHG